MKELRSDKKKAHHGGEADATKGQDDRDAEDARAREGAMRLFQAQLAAYAGPQAGTTQPTAWAPPAAYAEGRLPGDSEVVDVDTTKLRTAVHDDLRWPPGMKEDTNWIGWEQILHRTSPDYWMANIHGGEERLRVAWENDDRKAEGALVIRGKITNTVFDAVDGVLISSGATSTTSAGSQASGGVTSSVGVGAKYGNQGAEGSISVSESEARSHGVSESTGASVQRAAAPAQSARFRSLVAWSGSLQLTITPKMGTLGAFSPVPAKALAVSTQQDFGDVLSRLVTRVPLTRCTPIMEPGGV